MSYPVFYVPSGDVLPVMFSTFDGGTGASITMTGLAVTDIEIYKDGSVTQRASDAGYVLLDTDGIDFDAITGIHGFSIDTGDNTDAGFYTVGAWFTVVVSAVTVDAQTVNFIACQFRLMAAEGVAGVPDVNTTHVSDTAQTANDNGADINAILVDTAEIGAAGAGLTALATQASVNTIDDFLDTEIAAILSDTNAILVDTGTTLQAELDAIQAAVITNAAGVDIAADIIALKAETAAILVDTGTTLDAALAVVDANVDSILADTGTDGVVVNAAGLAADAVTEIRAIVSGTADSGTTTTMVDAARTEADTDYWKDMAILFTSGTISGQARLITAFNAATDTITFSPAVTQAVGTNTYEIIPNVAAAGASAPTAAEVADAVWDEAQADHATAGTFGEVATETAAILVDTAEIGVAGAGLTAINLPNQTMDITGNITGNLSGSVGSVTGAVGSVTGAVGSVTGDIGGLAAAAIADVWTTALTEAYAADGTAFTGAQALFMLWSFMAEKAIVTTTLTANKLDGVTAAMTFTLDDGTNPTSLTRAT